MKRIVTCESVFRGHPDKVCDQISDAILDACLKEDKKSRVACECAIKDNQVWLFGEITTNANVDYKEVAKRVLKDIGYDEEFVIREDISKQSNDIALGVDKEGAGDQGMMFGYAEHMLVPLMIAHTISNAMEALRKNKYSHLFGPDGKCQVSVAYDEYDNPVKVETIVVSTQIKEGVSLDEIKPIIYEEVLRPIVNGIDDVRVLINQTGAFVIGGPYADSGLTGRKIIVDTYGGVAHHGGGAFSGKDPSKVDRSGAYYCRYVAKALVEAGIAKRCEVGVAYLIGVAEPVSISVNTYDTCYASDEELVEFIKKNFDFTPANIRKELKLDEVKYEPLAYYGHFGRSDLNVAWEHVHEKAKELQAKW